MTFTHCERVFCKSLLHQMCIYIESICSIRLFLGQGGSILGMCVPLDYCIKAEQT